MKQGTVTCSDCGTTSTIEDRRDHDFDSGICPSCGKEVSPERGITYIGGDNPHYEYQ